MGSLEQLYQQVILDHVREKYGMEDPSSVDASSHQVNPACGNEVTLGITLDGKRLTPLQWDGDGCSISRVSLSMMTGLTQGKSVKEIGRLCRDIEVMMHPRNRRVDNEILNDLDDVAALESASRFANRMECALLGWHVLRGAMAESGIDTSTTGEPVEQWRNAHE